MHYPRLFLDEHIYSGFVRARYLNSQMYVSDRRFFELNNIKYHWLRSQVPLCENLGQVINNITNTPCERFKLRLYHTPVSPWFMSLQPEDNPKELTSSGGRNNIEENPYNIDKRWKFCTQCAVEDKKTIGISYWHTDHQSVGARICHQHQVPLNSSDALRYLNFSLPHHWLKKSETLSINQEWQTQWQPFIYKISKMLQINPDWRLIIQHEVKTYLGLPSKIKRNDKSMFNELFEIMKHELGDECLSGLFKGFDSNNNKRQTNLLWVTLSGFSRAEGVRHPLYWLSIIFWLRNKLPAYQAII